MKVKSLSRVRLFATPWTAASHVPPSMGFSMQEYWIGLPFPSPGDLPDSGIEPESPALQVDALPSKPPGKHIVNYNFCHTEIKLLHFATFFFFWLSTSFLLKKIFWVWYSRKHGEKNTHAVAWIDRREIQLDTCGWWEALLEQWTIQVVNTSKRDIHLEF